MALQLWLPLNGDVKNYGLDGNATIYSAYVKYISEGIIGSKSLGSGGLEITPSNFSKYNDFTLSFWSYPNEDLITSDWMGIIGIRDGGSNLRFQYCNNQWHSLGVYNNLDFKIMKSNFDTGYNMIGKYNRWVHSCITSNNNVLYLYVDGNLISSVSLQSDWNSHLKSIYTANIGKIYLSDLRLYNSTLSPKQIKLLSQAMICHYPMGNVDGKIGGRNLIRNSKFTNTSWSNNNCGVNIGNTNGSHFDYTTDGIRTVKKSGWGGTGIFIKPDVIPIEYEKTVTLSFDLKLIKFNDISFSSNANTAGDKSWWAQRVPNTNAGLDAAKKDLNSWHRVSCTIKIPAKNSMYEKERVVIIRLLDGSNGGDYEYYMKNLKLELGNIATPWTPAPEDNPPFYDNIIPDISGYQNNGEVTDSACPTWSNDSPRYLGSYEFNGKNQYISGLSPISNDTKEFTIAFWVKLNNDSNPMTFYTARVGIGSGVALFFANKNIRFDDNVQSTFNYTCDLSSNKWTHLCVTRNNTSKKLYVNGKLVDSTSNVGNMQNIGKYFTIGGSESSDNGIADMNWLNGNISDFRIYSTVLSDEDILDLYQSSASLDSQGNLILSGEVIE